MVNDPVCGMAVDPKKAKQKGLTSEKEGKTYYFCSKKCEEKFSKTWIGEHWIEVTLSIFIVVLASVMYLLGFMLPFMAVVFLILACLKLIDVKGFAQMFQQYDLIALQSKIYAYVYPFIEFSLGLMYLFQWKITIAAWITLIVMSIGAVGIGRNLFGKKLRCACLGSKINVPLTGFTLVEDIVMAAMGAMILIL